MARASCIKLRKEMYSWVASNQAFSFQTAFPRVSFDDSDKEATLVACAKIVVRGLGDGEPEAEAPVSAVGESTTIGSIILDFAFGSQGAIVDREVDILVLGFFAESLVA